MADNGHELTEEMLQELERKIAGEYAIAAKEMREKVEKYWERFAAREAEQKKLLDAGKITQEEFNNWRFRHTMIGERWEALLDSLAADAHNANLIARKIVSETMPGVYALNMNYETYNIEHGGEIDTGFVLYDRDAAEYLMRDRELMPGPSDKLAADIAANKDLQWNKRLIQSAVLQGIMQGDNPYDIAARMLGVAEMNYHASIRYARTMTTSAQNAGRYEAFERAEKVGVDLTIEWLATLDGRTRHDHRMMHGQRRKVGEPFITPDGFKIMWPADCSSGSSDAPQSEIWNCFVGETKVASDCEIVRSYKHEYDGDLIRIVSSAGVDFTCTPNHPILTPDGWIPAARLNKGDHLLITSVGNNGSLTGDGNVYHIHSSMKALHDSLHKFGVADNVSMSHFNFHGDIPTADVEIVSKKRQLRENGNLCFFESINKPALKKTNALIFCKSHLMARFRRINIATLRFMSRCCEPASLLRRRLGHADVHRLRSVPSLDTSVSEYAIDNLPTMTNIRRELLDGLAGNVFLDDIVAVYREPGRFNCHVYNLQTKSGYYFVGNSISQERRKCNGNYYAIAKNCRCTLNGWVKGFEGDTVKESPKMGGMSFEEWQQAKEHPWTAADKRQYEQYKALLGSKAPKSLYAFRAIKADPSAWENLKEAAREARKK